MPFPGSYSLFGDKFKTYWYVHCLPTFHQCSLDSPDLSAQEDSTRTINTADTQQILCQQGWFRSLSLTLISSWYSLTVIHNTLSDYQTGWWDNRFCSNTTVWVVLAHLLGRPLWPHRTPLHHLHQCCYHQAGIIESPWLRQRSTEDHLSLSFKYFK